jgi:mono/diheme cytochrome c family protein
VLLTLVGVLLSLAYPTLKKLYLKLNMSLLTGLIAVIVVIGTGAVMAVTGVIIADQQRIYEESLNPPPTITNTVLPSAESIARGETLYATHCLVWQGQSADFRALRNQLDDFRDDRLYDITVNGWRDLPPCEGNLSEAQRWDIINYVRTFEARGD